MFSLNFKDRGNFPGRLWVNILIIFVTLGWVVFSQSSQSWLKNRSSSSLSPDQIKIFQQEAQKEALYLQLLKQLPVLGFNNLMADWTFLKFLQYFGDDPARSTTGYLLGVDYFDVITRLDPRWVDSYLFLSTVISYYLGRPELTVELMERGTDVLSPKIHPKSWQVWRFKGLDQLLLLGDVPGSMESHKQAAAWTVGTPDAGYREDFLAIVEFLRQDPNSKLIRFISWSQVYRDSRDKVVRERAKQELLKLGARMEIDEKGTVNFYLRNTPSNSSKKSP